MTENEFLLSDRITKIKSINELYDLENNAVLSFSGGKDSTVLHYLLDEALPGNKIPRLFLNTGIEYKLILEFVKELAEKDNRVIIYNVGKNIKETLERVGYPFKSKEYSQKVYEWKKGYKSESHKAYFGFAEIKFQRCPNKLMYQINDDFKLKISNLCCYEFKKKPFAEWLKNNNKTVTMTGMMKSEGGVRNKIDCISMKDGKLHKFHPLAPLNSEFEKWFIREREIKLCKLYYPPYNFERTGCKGCPFALKLQDQLDLMQIFLPAERKQCENIWEPVYNEYRRIGYRLRRFNNLLDDLL